MRRVGDELRVRAHLGVMDARDTLHRWIPVLQRLERRVVETGETVATLVIGSFETAKGRLFAIRERRRKGAQAPQR